MHFNPHVYHDLLRCGDGSAEGLITAFFDVVRSSSPLVKLVRLQPCPATLLPPLWISQCAAG